MPSTVRIPALFLFFLLLLSFAPAQQKFSASSTPMDVVHGKPYVMVTVNGRGPYRFVVDTGTGGDALVTPALAQILELPVIGQARLTDPSGRGEQRTQILFVDSLSVAGVSFNNIKVIRHALAGEDDTCMGLLGFTLFKNHLLTLDYPNHRLSLASGSLAPADDGSVLSFTMPSGVPIVPLNIDGERIEAQLDSGGIGLTLPERLASHLKFTISPVVFGNGQSLNTRFQVKAGRLSSDVRIGPYAFEHPVVEVHPVFPIANFGACPMQNFTITFDQQNLLVRLESEKKVLHLDSMPTSIRMQNAPPPKPPDLALIPVG